MQVFIRGCKNKKKHTFNFNEMMEEELVVQVHLLQKMFY